MALILSSQSNLIFNIFSSKLYKIRVGHFKIRFLDYLDKKLRPLTTAVEHKMYLSFRYREMTATKYDLTLHSN